MAKPARERFAAVVTACRRCRPPGQLVAADDLLVYDVRLLAEHPTGSHTLRQRWKWLVVDEMQDTGPAVLTGQSKRSLAVGLAHVWGDPDGGSAGLSS